MTTIGTDSDRDAMHILPLDTVCLQNESLQQARLIKNSRLECVVELFSGQETGSGQIAALDLRKSFDFSGDKALDLELIQTLSALPSYDVYSLRMELGRMGIGVVRASTLSLTDEKCKALAPYMAQYTKPLAVAIFGEGASAEEDCSDLMAIMANPDPLKARANIEKLARAMEISVPEVPAFLEDYADFLRSATYYPSNANRLEPLMWRFAAETERIFNDTRLRGDAYLVRICLLVRQRIDAIYHQARNFLDLFDKKMGQLWLAPTGKRYLALQSFMENGYIHLGGALCGLTVKLWAWEEAFNQTASAHKKAEFIARDMKEGLDPIPLIGKVMAA